MVITAIPRQISIPNSNTINLRTCSNIVFQHFFRKSNITRDISVQRAWWSGRVGSGRAGPVHLGNGFSGWKHVFFVIWTIFQICFVFEIFNCFVFPYTGTGALSLSRRESSLCELASLRSASLAIIILTHKVQLPCIFKLYAIILYYSILFWALKYFSNRSNAVLHRSP